MQFLKYQSSTKQEVDIAKYIAIQYFIASVRMQFSKCQSSTKQEVNIAKYIAIQYFIASV
jgi:hypothetical protein